MQRDKMLLSPADRLLTLFLLLPRWAEREEYLNSSLYLHSSGSLGTSRSAFQFIWLLDLRQIAWRLPQSAIHRGVQIVRKLGLTLLAVFMLGITGCHKSIGPKTIPRDRKRTFSSMLFLFTLADTGGEQKLPTITIPEQ
jgi:hypothetical protein